MSSTSAGNVSTIPDTRNQICFEQPLGQRVRTLLRLEFLSTQAYHHLGDDTDWGRRATLNAFLDILVVLSASDIKVDIIKELTEQQSALHRLERHHGVDQRRLTQVLEELSTVLDAMHQISAQSPNALLHDKEFLSQLSNRSTIPGGTCGFDLPSYQHWLGQPESQRSADLYDWFDRIKPFQEAASLILRLIRDSEKPVRESASGGVFIYNLTGPCQLLRVFVPTPSSLYPEISADRHRFSIRFMEQKGGNERAIPTKEDVDFQLARCAL